MWSYITFIVFLIGFGAMLFGGIYYAFFILRDLRGFELSFFDVRFGFGALKLYKEIFQQDKHKMIRYWIVVVAFITAIMCILALFLITQLVGLKKINVLWQQFD